MRYEADDAGRLAPVKEDNNVMRKIDYRYVVVSKFGDYKRKRLKIRKNMFDYKPSLKALDRIQFR